MPAFKRNFNFQTNLYETLATNVRRYRKEKGLTQEQLALDIEISYDYLRRFESQKGREGLSFETIYRISVVLDTPIDLLIKEQKN